MLTSKAVFIWSPNKDPNRSHQSYFTAYAAGLLQWGIEPVFLTFGSDGFDRALQHYLNDESVAFFVTMQGFCSDVRVRVGDNEDRNVFDYFGKYVVALCGDYPNTKWLYSALCDDHPYRIFLFHDHSIPEFVRLNWPNLKAGIGVLTSPSNDHRYRRAAAEIPPGAREPIVFHSGNYLDPQLARDAVQETIPEYQPAFEAAIEAALWDFDTPIWQTCRSVLSQYGFASDLTAPGVRSFFELVDRFVRYERRKQLFPKLAARPVIFIGNSVPDHALHPRSQWLGRLPQNQNIALFERARQVVMVQPNFAWGMPERLLNAAARGAVAVSTGNPEIRSYFPPGEAFVEIKPGLDNVIDCIDYVNDCPDEAAAIQQRAQAIVDRQYRPVTVAESLLAELARLGVPLDGAGPWRRG